MLLIYASIANFSISIVPYQAAYLFILFKHSILSLTSSNANLFLFYAALSLSNSSFSAKASYFISFVKASIAKFVTSPIIFPYLGLAKVSENLLDSSSSASLTYFYFSLMISSVYLKIGRGLLQLFQKKKIYYFHLSIFCILSVANSVIAHKVSAFLVLLSIKKRQPVSLYEF